MSSWEMEFGSKPPAHVDGVLREVVDGQMAAHMSANQRAARAWYRANGTRERKHTAGVFLKRARVQGAAPILGVYVDSHAMATDFGVNKDIYLARLSNVGFEVSGIEFLVSRKPRQASGSIRKEPPVRYELPELTPDELEEVNALVAELPESLRASASQAVALSMRREKLKSTDN